MTSGEPKDHGIWAQGDSEGLGMTANFKAEAHA